MFKAYGRYFDFQGRSRRSEFWLFTLWCLIAAVAAMMIDVAAFGGADTLATDGFSGPVYILVVLVNFIPGLAVQVRRLHDTNRSGWRLLWALVPIVGFILLLIWFCESGTPGANKYGPDPKGGSAPAEPGLTTSTLDRLEQLARLRDSGALSQEEFDSQKAALLGAR